MARFLLGVEASCYPSLMLTFQESREHFLGKYFEVGMGAEAHLLTKLHPKFLLLKLKQRGVKGNLPPVIPEDGYWRLFHSITQITLAVRLFPFLIV